MEDTTQNTTFVEPACVIGTNSWGSQLYERAVRGSYVADETIADAVDLALGQGLDVFDTADDYGFGYAQKLLGRLGRTRDLRLSAKYTPVGRYRYGQVYKAFDKQCKDLGVDSVDYYWLHLPNDIEQNLTEISDLYHRGKVRHVGVSNFSLDEAVQAKKFLEAHEVPLYGVQNHFSLLDRGEETSGMLAWCQENGISFWGWAVLEEGILTGDPKGPIGQLLKGKVERLEPLFTVMGEIGRAHDLSVAQVAVVYCMRKGVVPVCGCRKPYQVEQLVQDARASLDADEIRRLEREADKVDVRVLRSDMFRFAVHGERFPRGSKRAEAVARRRRLACAIGLALLSFGAGAACTARYYRSRLD